MKKRKNGLSIIVLIIALTVIAGSALNKMQAEGNNEISLKNESLVLKDVSVAEMTDTRQLYLVNDENRVDDVINEFETVPAFKMVSVARTSIELNTSVLEALEKWFDAGKKKNFDKLYVTSGYRDFNYQKNLYDEAFDKSYVQPAGASEHHTGLAVDIALEEVSIKQLANTAEGMWLTETAKEYGFILRYPKDKVRITKISYEPWHFRFVGQPHSYLIEENNLSLEEYIDLLIKGREYIITLNESRYLVYYTEAVNGYIKVPDYSEYNVSGTNTGNDGFIVTVKDY